MSSRAVCFRRASQVVLVVKTKQNLPVSAGDVRDTSSIPGSGPKSLQVALDN